MFSLYERVLRTTRSASEKQIDAGARLAAGAMRGMHEVVDLNINMVRATIEQTNFAVRQLLSARDLKELLALAGAQLEPNAHRGFDYGYYLVTITTGLQSQLIRFVGERVDDANHRLDSLADTAGQAQATDAVLALPEIETDERLSKSARITSR